MSRETFDCGGYTAHWNEAISALQTISKEPERLDEMFAACLVLVTDEAAGIQTDLRSSETSQLAANLQLMLELRAAAVPPWEKLVADIAGSDWNKKFALPENDKASWTEYSALRTLHSVAKAACALVSGDRAGWRCALGDATLAAAQYRADMAAPQFAMPPYPSSEFYNERVEEKAAWERAITARERAMEEIRTRVYRAQERAFTRLLQTLQQAQRERDAAKQAKVKSGWLSRETLFSWARPSDLR